MSNYKVRIGVLLGDPSGIGPEVICKLLAEKNIYKKAIAIVIGDKRIFHMGEKIAVKSIPLKSIDSFDGLHKYSNFNGPLFYDYPTISPKEVKLGKIDKKAGYSVYRTLLYTLDLAKEKKIDGFIFASFNKEAMRLGGSPYQTEFDLFKDYFKKPKIHGEINVLNDLWITRVTSHIALSKVSSMITEKRVYETICFMDSVLKDAGSHRPHIAVAALNPHGGEGGMFGTKEIVAIGPAIAKARLNNINVEGPFPADTIFLKVRKEKYNGVISMYHDQGQIATKIMGFEKGVTIHGGMPMPIATCAHGTAFDIAGKGIAKHIAIKNAFLIVTKIALNKRKDMKDDSRS